VLGPIFAREALTVPRRARHYVIRAAYLGSLWVLGLTAWQATVGWSQTPTLDDAGQFGRLLFQLFTLGQLVFVIAFAALSAAGAIIQEKDRRTFVLLLITDLRNHEIVLGKVLGSLLHIGLLLVSSVPLLALLILLGGTSLKQVVEAVLLLGATGLAAGSLGGLVALWRERTFPALALTLLFLVLYLIGTGFFLGWVPALQPWLSPYHAWLTVAFPAAEGDGGAVPAAVGYAAAMLLVSVVLNVWGIVMLRRWNPSGEPVQQREAPVDAEEEEKDRLKAHAAPGMARPVWANPILWREVRTRAYGRLPLLVKLAWGVVLALVFVAAVLPVLRGEAVSALTPIFGLVSVGVLALLLVAAQAVTAITSERDIGALDLLLVTDLTPQEFIFGKLGGILWNTKEYLLPPLILALFYGHYWLLAKPPADHPELAAVRNLEATASLVGASVVMLAFAVVLGLHVALRNDRTRLAILNTLGTVFFLTVGTLVCIYLILINGGRFEYQWLSFIFFIAAGIGGLWWVLSGNRPSAALTIASWACPVAVFYTVVNLVVAKPGTVETADPLVPFLVIAAAFGFTLAAMLVPLVSEFDVALGRTTGGAGGE
jgi:ABC-type transport system involved in multi-copper enzyme maturation permease subunit